jgi:hypothetical protein
MSVLGTYNFNPKIGICLEEAFERGPLMAPSAIGGDHIESAMRSISFMLSSEWPAHGLKNWKVLQGTHTAVANATSFVPDEPGLQDILAMVLRRNGKDTQMVRMSREDYLNIVSKNQTSRPTNYFVENVMVAGVYTTTVKVWQAMQNSTDVFVYDYLVKLSVSGTPANTLDMPPHVFDAFVAGLAARLAQKFKPERFADLQTQYCGNPVGPGNRPLGGALWLAIQESRDRSDTRLHIRGR